MDMDKNTQAALRLLAEAQRLAGIAPAPATAARMTIRTETGEFLGEVVLSVRAADALADAVGTVCDYAEAMPADFQATPVQPASALSDDERDVFDQLDDVFSRIDLDALTKTVLNNAKPADRLTVTRAIDGMFGHIPHQDTGEGEL